MDVALEMKNTWLAALIVFSAVFLKTNEPGVMLFSAVLMMVFMSLIAAGDRP